MLAKPKLKTAALMSPPGAKPVALTRKVTATSASPFDGQPDPNSPAQRTLHQALANRLIGQANVYNCLREYALRASWGFQPETAPGVTITLAIAHQSHGPKFAIVIKNAQWSTAAGDELVDQGWHVLTVDSTALVQSPQEAVSDILGVLQFFAGLPFGTGALPEPDHEDDHPASDARAGRFGERGPQPAAPAAKPVRAERRAKAVRLPVMAVLSALLASALGLYAVQDQVSGGLTWLKGAEYQTRVKSVEITKEGHAAVTMADGRKGFVPARSVRQNPNLLHDLIVAWRQGKLLSVFTTTKQHIRYGREIGIKGESKPAPKPKAGKSAKPRPS